MAQAIHPAFETAIAAQPSFLVKKQPQHRPGNEAEQDPKPAEEKVHLGLHIPRTVAMALIDKSAGNIEILDASAGTSKAGRNGFIKFNLRLRGASYKPMP